MDLEHALRISDKVNKQLEEQLTVKDARIAELEEAISPIKNHDYHKLREKATQF